MSEPHLPKGYQFAGASCGIKSQPSTKDVALVVSTVPAVAAGVYTQNQVVAAPVVLSRSRTPCTDCRVVVVNSGNANACTGAQAAADAEQMSAWAAAAVSATAEQALVMSTGIIGRPLPMQRIAAGIRDAAARLSEGVDAFLDAADAILTTDAGRKIASRRRPIGGRDVTVLGMAKGAGMIGPNMATMLCCVMTDAPLSSDQAQRLLTRAADRSFNNISVEGHTSTNDTMLLLANGQAGGPEPHGRDEVAMAEMLDEVCVELAKMIPADGEGATHLIEIHVAGARCDADARCISHAVASSNLVKTAIHGGDPNWGRIVSAAGYAGPEIEVDQLSLRINEIPLFARGEPLAFDAAAASRSIRDQHTTRIELTVGRGTGQCTHWTSDLGIEYVRFNAEYTT